jgi:hypothetical protein
LKENNSLKRTPRLMVMRRSEYAKKETSNLMRVISIFHGEVDWLSHGKGSVWACGVRF